MDYSKIKELFAFYGFIIIINFALYIVYLNIEWAKVKKKNNNKSLTSIRPRFIKEQTNDFVNFFLLNFIPFLNMLFTLELIRKIGSNLFLKIGVKFHSLSEKFINLVVDKETKWLNSCKT